MTLGLLMLLGFASGLDSSLLEGRFVLWSLSIPMHKLYGDTVTSVP